MKKNFFRIMAIALAAMLVITGCSGENTASVSKKTVRVIGTYGTIDNAAAKALSRAPETEKMGITSVDKVVVNGKDIKDDLKPVDPNAAPGNNVEFEAQVEVPSKVTFSAEAKPGFVFDEWEVLEDKKASKENPDLKDTLEKIEDWLEKDGREDQETLTDIPAEYIPYLVAEYDNGFYIDLEAADDNAHDGTKSNAYSVAEFTALLNEKYDEDELTLVITGKDTAKFQELIKALTTERKDKEPLEEVKIKAAGVELTTLPELAGLEELSLEGFTFTDAVVIGKTPAAPAADKAEEEEEEEAEFEYKFANCTFKNTLTVNYATEIELIGCTLNDVVVESVGEMEIKGGKAETITVNAKVVEEIEIKNLTATNIDLSAIEEGEVELKKVTCDNIVAPKTKDYEVK